MGEALVASAGATAPPRNASASATSGSKAASTGTSDASVGSTIDRADPKAGWVSDTDPASLWDELGYNSLVIAAHLEDGDTDGWYEATIIAVHGEVYRLRWLYDPDEPSFTRTRKHIAVIYPHGDAKPFRKVFGSR